MYRTVSNNFKPGEPFDYDMLVFFTPAGIKSYITNFPDYADRHVVIAAMGQTTLEAAAKVGLQVDVTITPQNPSMASAIDHYLKKAKAEEEKVEKKAAKQTKAKPAAPKKEAPKPAAKKDMSEEEKLFAKRSEAAKKAAATRRAKAEAEREAAAKRSEAAKKAAATRRAKAETKKK